MAETMKFEIRKLSGKWVLHLPIPINGFDAWVFHSWDHAMSEANRLTSWHLSVLARLGRRSNR